MLFDLPLWANIAIYLVVGIPLVGLLLFMAGALCGAEKLDFLRSTLIAVLHYAILAPIAWMTFSSIGGSDWELWWKDTRTLLLGAAICLPASLVVQVILLRTPLTSVSVPRGILVWFVEIPLYALFAAVIAGGMFVWLGIKQVARDEWTRDLLIQGGWIFGGFLAAIVVLVFGVSMLRRFGRAR
jgi:hypothetical protein